MKINEALFSGSSTRISEKPKQKFPEFAFIGRSNVGKSSLFNCLAGFERAIVTEREFTEMVLSESGAPVLEEATGRVKTEKKKRTVAERFDFSQFRDLYLKVSTDVGESTYFSEIAMTQTLDNLRQDGTLDVIQYLERIPDKLIPKKQELIDELKGRIAEGKQANAAAGAALPEPGSPLQGPNSGMANNPTVGGPLSPEKAFSSLPASSQVAFANLPHIAEKTALHQGAERAE